MGVSKKRIRLRSDSKGWTDYAENDCYTESRTSYAENSESADDEVTSTAADVTETEAAVTIDHEQQYAKGTSILYFALSCTG